MNLEIDNVVRVIEEPVNLIDDEKVLLCLKPDSQWSYLMHENDEQVGIAFTGPSILTVDAIAETQIGAIGKPIISQLEGIQFYIGETDLESTSQVADATESPFRDKPFEEVVKEHFFNFKSCDLKISLPYTIFFGRDENDTKIFLLLSHDKIVFTHGKHIFIMNNDRMLLTDNKGVVLAEREGLPFYIKKSQVQRSIDYKR